MSGFGTTLGDKLGDIIGNEMADNPVKGNPIVNQPEQTLSAQTPDGIVETVTIPANAIKDDLIKSWEQIGRKLVEFFASMDKGSSTGFTFGLSSGEKLEYSPGSIKITVGNGKVEITSSDIKATYGSASCDLGLTTAELKFGASSVKASATGVKISASTIELN
jgi:hypothetical protein